MTFPCSRPALLDDLYPVHLPRAIHALHHAGHVSGDVHGEIRAALLKDLRELVTLTDEQTDWITRLLDLEFTGRFPEQNLFEWGDRFKAYARIYVPASEEDAARPGLPAGAPDVLHFSEDLRFMERTLERANAFIDLLHEDEQDAAQLGHLQALRGGQDTSPRIASRLSGAPTCMDPWVACLRAQQAAYDTRRAAILDVLWAHLAACFPTLNAEQHATLRRACEHLLRDLETFVLMYHAVASQLAPVDETCWTRLSATVRPRRGNLMLWPPPRDAPF